MRFRLEATEEELREKGEQLVDTLSKSLEFSHPELSEILEKALPRKEHDLKYRALRELKAKVAKEYESTMQAMIKEIGQVLDDAVRKSEDEPAGFYDHTQPIAQKDDILYGRVKKLVMERGYRKTDFEKDGALYGWSTNQLLDLLRTREK